MDNNNKEITNQTKNKFGIIGFVLSISGVISLTLLFGGSRCLRGFPFHWWYPYLSLIIFASSFVFSFVGLIAEVNKKMTLWSSIVGLILSFVFLILIIFFSSNH